MPGAPSVSSSPVPLVVPGYGPTPSVLTEACVHPVCVPRLWRLSCAMPMMIVPTSSILDVISVHVSSMIPVVAGDDHKQLRSMLQY